MDNASLVGIEECIEPLLKSAASRRKGQLKVSFDIENVFFSKVSILILLWTFSTGLFYNLFIKPYSFLQSSDPPDSAVLAVLILSVFLLSP